MGKNVSTANVEHLENTVNKVWENLRQKSIYS
jgi:hypothetical protein